MEIKQKWIFENWVYYPIPGNTTLHVTPGTGVFQIFQEKSMGALVLDWSTSQMPSNSTSRFITSG